jgi:hypothetical protein
MSLRQHALTAIIAGTALCSAAPDTLQPPPARLLWLELSADIGTVLSWDGADFLQRYRTLTQAEDFPTTFPPGVYAAGSLRIPLDTAWQARLSAGVELLQVDHTYQQKVLEEGRRGERVIRTLLQLQSVPVWLGVEWLPFRTQFRTSLHAAAGLVPLKLRWLESITTTLPGDSRLGGTYRDEWLLRYGVRAAVGVALSFDAAARGSLLEGLRVEAAYTFVPLSEPLLEPVAAQISGAPAANERIRLRGSSVTLSLSLVLQLPLLLR